MKIAIFILVLCLQLKAAEKCAKYFEAVAELAKLTQTTTGITNRFSKSLIDEPHQDAIVQVSQTFGIHIDEVKKDIEGHQPKTVEAPKEKAVVTSSVIDYQKTGEIDSNVLYLESVHSLGKGRLLIDSSGSFHFRDKENKSIDTFTSYEIKKLQVVGDYVAIVGEQGYLKVFKVNDSSVEVIFKHPVVSDAKLSPDGKRIAFYFQNNFVVVDLESGKKLINVWKELNASAYEWGKDSNHLVLIRNKLFRTSNKYVAHAEIVPGKLYGNRLKLDKVEVIKLIAPTYYDKIVRSYDGKNHLLVSTVPYISSKNLNENGEITISVTLVQNPIFTFSNTDNNYVLFSKDGKGVEVSPEGKVADYDLRELSNVTPSYDGQLILRNEQSVYSLQEDHGIYLDDKESKKAFAADNNTLYVYKPGSLNDHTLMIDVYSPIQKPVAPLKGPK